MLLTEFLAERSAHDGAAHAGWGAEVRLARLSPGGMEVWQCQLSFRSSRCPIILVLILVILAAGGSCLVVEAKIP